MSSHSMTITWQRDGATFVDQRYSRAHTWQFDGGAVVTASSSPHVVPLPHSDPTGVDPEEAFVAAIASCHMLWFLSLAARAGFTVDDYRDEPVGTMGKDASGAIAMLRIALRPRATFAGTTVPSDSDLARLHHASHQACFLANSIKTDVVVEPQPASA